MKKVYVNYQGNPKSVPGQLRKGRTPFLIFDNTPTSKVRKRAKNLARSELARLFSTSEKEIVIQSYSLELDMD